jgi:hypothetical protein
MATANTQAQLLHGSKIYEVLQYYYSPRVVDSSANFNSLYAFIGQVTPWPNEIDPPVPTQDQQSIKQYFKNIIATKLVTSSDISPVIPRRDWTANVIYDYYEDSIDMLATDANNIVQKNFYVRNRFDQIFKCLWNNNDAPSTVEPQFLPGTFDNTFLVKTADGYKWKFMYSLDSGSKQKFFDADWMPVPVTRKTPNPVDTFAAQGSIDVVNVTTVGEGYTQGGVTITINGDGRFANAIALVNNAGYLYDVAMSNTGTGYTYAETVINVLPTYSLPNVPAVAIAPTSPIGGHGFDPISELGCNHVMVAPEFIEDENGKISTDMAYRQIGLLLNPVSQESVSQDTSTYANGAIYDVTTKLFVSPGSGNYVSGQTVYQGSSFVSSTFNAEVVSFDPATNIVSAININGTPVNNQALIQDASGPVTTAVRTLLTTENPDFIIYSGYPLYIENREAINRSPDGTEQFRIVLSF